MNKDILMSSEIYLKGKIPPGMKDMLFHYEVTEHDSVSKT